MVRSPSSEKSLNIKFLIGIGCLLNQENREAMPLDKGRLRRRLLGLNKMWIVMNHLYFDVQVDFNLGNI